MLQPQSRSEELQLPTHRVELEQHEAASLIATAKPAATRGSYAIATADTKQQLLWAACTTVARATAFAC